MLIAIDHGNFAIKTVKDYKYTGAMVNFKCENLTIRAKA